MRILRRIALLASLTQALAAQTIREENLGPPSVLPSRSDRIANYTMEVKLDPAKKTVSGWLILDWRNTSERELGEFWFHAYLNAFQNNKSTHMIEGKGEPLRKVMKEDDWGYLNIRSIRLLADDYFQEADLTGTLRYVQPDDGNKEDRTVFKISTSQPLPPGRSVRFRIEFVSKLPIGMQRTGW
ncbi:MAG: hypothetical protein HY652_08855, partial [Acidobacteria bacterium]|nr:hypothetical protein [Acidobacteriota bacterium]